MSRQNQDLPTYTASVPFENLPEQNLDSGINAQLSALQNFNQGVQAVGEAGLKVDNAQKQQTLKYNISKTYEGWANEAIQNPNALEGQQQFLKKSKDYQEQLAAQSNALNRGYVNNVAQSYETSYNKKLATRTLKQSAVTGKFNFSEQYNQGMFDQQNTIDTDNTNNFALSHAVFNKNMQLLKYGLLSGNLTFPEYEREAKQAPVDFALSLSQRSLQNTLQQKGFGEAANLYKKLSNHPGVDLTFEQSQKFHAGLAKIFSQQMQSIGITSATVDDMYKKAVVDRQQNGTALNQGLVSLINYTDPKGASVKIQRLEEAGAEYAFRNIGSSVPPFARQAYLSKLKDHLVNQKMNPDEINDWMNKANAAVIRGYDAFKKDPAKYSAQDPTVQHIYNDQANLQAIGADKKNLTKSPFNPLSPDGMNAIKAHQLQMGMTVDAKYSSGNRVKLMTNDMANQKVVAFNQADPVQTFGLVQELYNESGSEENFRLNMDQLHNSGLAGGLSSIVDIDRFTPQINQVLNAIKTPVDGKDGLKLRIGADNYTAIEQAVRDNMTGSDTNLGKLNASYKGVNQGDAQILNANQLAATKIGAQLLASGQASSPTEAAQKASNIIGSRYNYINVNNVTIPYPKEFSGNLIAGMAVKMKQQLPLDQFQLNKNPYGAINTPEEAERNDKENIKNGYFVVLSDGLHLGWADVNGYIRRLKNGKPYEFSFEDANHLMKGELPDVQKELDQQKAKLDSLYKPIIPEVLYKREPGIEKQKRAIKELKDLKDALQPGNND